MEYVSSIERVLLARERRAGYQEGQQEIGTALLARLLTRRFGVLPTQWQQHLQGASMAQIEAWFDLAATATTLDEVFQDLPH